ncbi:MAG: transposase, partial [Methylococcales bacterium]|nr:transposase [Methylococcales bacterium]MDD5632766.1 transposase [Methylococcales bacterium]
SMAFISACKSWMFKERKNLYFLICCQGILVAFEFAMDFKVDTSKRGNAHKHPKKSIVDAILYVLRGGIQWLMMPKDFPPWDGK